MAPTRADLLLNTLESIQDTQKILLIRQDSHQNELLKRMDAFENDYGRRLRRVEREHSVLRAGVAVGSGLVAWAGYNWQAVKHWLTS